MMTIDGVCLVLTLARHHAKHFTYATSLNPHTILFNTQSYSNDHLILTQSKLEPLPFACVMKI